MTSEHEPSPEKQPFLRGVVHLGRCATQLTVMYMQEKRRDLRARLERFDPTDCFGEDNPEDAEIKSGRWA
jgi:hypothetical protein